MSTTIGLGVPMPKMLRKYFPYLYIHRLFSGASVARSTNLFKAVLGTWAAPFTAYLVFLSGRVTYTRVKNERWLGEKLNQDVTDKDTSDGSDPLELYSRCHVNFVENVPIAFLLAGIAELNGANRTVLNYALGTLLVLRVAHAEFGLRGKKALGVGRPIGFFGTLGWLAGAASYSIYLVKGYWGF